MKRFFKRLVKKNSQKLEPSVKEPKIPNITWQHIWSYDETQNALSQSMFARIPNEIILDIFKFLSVSDLCNISLVCRRFKMLADQDDIWKFKCITSTKFYSKSFKQMYMDWIYMKCLRSAQLKNTCRFHRTTDREYLPLLYLIRPTAEHHFEIIGGFHQHPNSSATMINELSVDMEKTVRKLINLLEKASKFGKEWQQSSILKQMITRYYRFMKLKASHPSNILLIPTLDIEIVWQTHLLRPEMYQTDCLRLFHQVIDHSLLLFGIEKLFKYQAFQDTCQYYEQQYGEQYCPSPVVENKRPVASYPSYDLYGRETDTDFTYSYWDMTHFQFSSSSPKDYENPFSFTEGDLIMDNQWLDLSSRFMYDPFRKYAIHECFDPYTSTHIDLRSGPIKLLKKTYERFLYMAAKYPLKNDGIEFIPPTYAIDIMWHSHMQEPLKYVSDCLRLVGYVIQHDPWPMIEDATMKNARNQIEQMWKDEFQADIISDHLIHTITDYL